MDPFVRSRHIPSLCSLFAGLSLTLVSSNGLADPPSYTLFESGQVRPLALSPDGKWLYAANSPDNRLEIFRVKNTGLDHRGSVQVGMDPVAVAARNNNEVWVVNHLSDSVSIVDVSQPKKAHVVRTLLVGDEPRDIVFAGPGKSRAFITTAHRGQNVPYNPQLTTPGVGRADVWVFDATTTDSSLGGIPLTILNLFSDTPRALAVTPDGSKVYAAAFHSGNRSTGITDTAVPDGGELAPPVPGGAPGGVPGPNTNFQGIFQPEVGVLVQFNGSDWLDIIGRSWNNSVKFNLPDKDVFVIDAMQNPPAQFAGTSGYFSGVGTVLYNMAVNPVSGKIYVSNTEAFNVTTRFSGPGIFAGETSRGRFHEERITVLSPSGVTPRHVNKHIDFSTCCAPIPNTENEKSLALLQNIVVSGDGTKLYVAALGSDKIGVFNTQALENNTFVPSTANQIPVTGGGPMGIVLDENYDRLYALTRFDNSISVINTNTQAEIDHLPMYSPEPPEVIDGRRFLYDASFGSSHGASACATCHVFGDFDGLTWDLGNPDDEELNNPGPFMGLDILIDKDHRPMKGPMNTQSLRGLANHGPMHWRGDRTGGNDEPTAQPDSGSFDENAAFLKFSQTFIDVNGRPGPISPAIMQAFADFMLRNTYPPNPIRNLDNSFTPQQQAGSDFFFNSSDVSDFTNRCGDCHIVDRNANPDDIAPGFFGTQGFSAFEFISQMFKAPHMRNLYQKVGMFGMGPADATIPGDHDHKGDQIRGFGYFHDGTFDTIKRFHRIVGFAEDPIFNPGGFPPDPAGDVIRDELTEFLLAFDSNMFPIVGQQVTLTTNNAIAANPRIDLLIARADAGECDLIAKTRLVQSELGFLYIGSGQFLTSRQQLPSLSDTALRGFATQLGLEVTYTCTPPGSGERMGLDRDEDGYLDGDEEDAHTDPGDPISTP